MTDLERLARVACEADGHNPDGKNLWKGKIGHLLPGVVNWQKYEDSVRAILKAIREPSEEMTEVGREKWSLYDWENRPWNERVNGLFRAMIDTILEEK